jgi:pimeloyl-ACP methyl ester carboxylesterase
MPDPIQAEPQTYPAAASGVKAARHVLVFINGILAAPGDSEGWTDRAVTWTHLHTDFRAEKLEYFTGALTRRLYQRERARKFARMLERYADAGFTFSLIGHSNGCDLILRIAQLLALVHPIRHVHLVAAAAEADAERNGLNELLCEGTVGRAQIYASRADRALGLARLTSRPLSLLGLGYGSLGLTGPANIAAAVASRVSVIDRPGFGHSTWFADEFDASPSVTPRLTPFE